MKVKLPNFSMKWTSSFCYRMPRPYPLASFWFPVYCTIIPVACISILLPTDRVAQNKIYHQTICNFSAANRLIFKFPDTFVKTNNSTVYPPHLKCTITLPYKKLLWKLQFFNGDFPSSLLSMTLCAKCDVIISSQQIKIKLVIFHSFFGNF